MPLLNCPDCSAQVSDSAPQCLHCGFKLRREKRSLIGKLIKWSFVAFNILMLVWLVGGFHAATSDMENLSGAEQAGAAIGTGLGVAMILGLWMVGDVILGILVLLTRPKS